MKMVEKQSIVNVHCISVGIEKRPVVKVTLLKQFVERTGLIQSINVLHSVAVSSEALKTFDKKDKTLTFLIDKSNIPNVSV